MKPKQLLWLAALWFCSLPALAQWHHAEYFWDTDPGPGNGTPINLNVLDAHTADYNGNIATTGLSEGMHTLYIRTMDETQGWSLYEKRSITIQNPVAAITKAEYFFNTDPGVGNGTEISLTGLNNFTSEYAGSIATTGLPAGSHVVYVRAYTAQTGWSIYEKRYFNIIEAGSLISEAEYFFDTDPGVGNGTELPITQQNGFSDLTAQISSNELSPGYHNLYIRVKKNGTGWSLYEKKYFYVKPVLERFEYYVDKDPGAGNGKPLEIVAATDEQSFTGNVKPTCLNEGDHTIYVRARDNSGQWSSVYLADDFHQNGDWMSTTLQSPGPGPYGTPVRLLTSTAANPAGLEYHNLTANSNWQTDRVQMMPNIATHQFEVRDGEGCRDTLSYTTNLDPQLISTTGSVANNNIDFNGWGKWVYVLDPSNNIIAALNDNGQDLGNVTVDHAVLTQTLRTHNAVPYLNRNFKIDTENAPSSPVGVRLYVLDQEVNDLMVAEPTITTAEDMRLIKYDGINEDLDLANNGAESWIAYLPQYSTFSNSSQTGYMASAELSSFSELYFAKDLAVALPVKLLSFTGTRKAQGVMLNWQVNNEQGILRYELQRSTNCSDFTTLHSVSALNIDQLHAYDYFDADPPTGATLCYRLRIVDTDGKISYSSVVRMDGATNKNMYSLNPNPVVNGTAKLQIKAAQAEDVYYQIVTQNHALLMQGKVQVVSGANNFTLQLGKLPAGNYVLKLFSRATGEYALPFINL